MLSTRNKWYIWNFTKDVYSEYCSRLFYILFVVCCLDGCQEKILLSEKRKKISRWNQVSKYLKMELTFRYLRLKYFVFFIDSVSISCLFKLKLNHTYNIKNGYIISTFHSKPGCRDRNFLLIAVSKRSYIYVCMTYHILFYSVARFHHSFYCCLKKLFLS